MFMCAVLIPVITLFLVSRVSFLEVQSWFLFNGSIFLPDFWLSTPMCLISIDTKEKHGMNLRVLLGGKKPSIFSIPLAYVKTKSPKMLC